MNNTNTKNRKGILLILGLLLLLIAAFFGIRYFTQRSIVLQSSPNYAGQSEQAGTQETIAEEEVPLAAPESAQPAEAIAFVSEMQPVTNVATPATNVAAPQAPAQEQPSTPVTPTNPETPEEPQQPVVKSTAATRLLERANALLTQYNACKTADEKRALLGAPNYSLGNDAIRTKLLADMGGCWEPLEEEVVDATQYQQGKALYVQVYMSDLSSDFVPVVYTTQNSDRSGNQWFTNLVYNDETTTWMEYTQKHPYNSSRESFNMTTLGNNEDGWEELKDTMETSPVWEEVVVPDASADASAPIPPDGTTEG
jgi:hypothetical protein